LPFKLSGHAKWLSFSLKDEQKGVDSVIVEPNVAQVSLKMLARGEAVWFNGLVADWPYDDDDDDGRLSIDFRIAETSNAKVKSLSLAAGGHPVWAIMFGVPGFIIMSIGIWFVLQGDVTVLRRPPSFHYVVEHEGRQIRYAELRPVAEDRVALGHYVPIERKWWHYGAGANGVRFETLTVLSVAELFRTDRVNISVEQSERPLPPASLLYVVSGFLFFMAFLLSLPAFRRFRDHRLLRRAVPQQEKWPW
jgi:hypothetical protein